MNISTVSRAFVPLSSPCCDSVWTRCYTTGDPLETLGELDKAATTLVATKHKTGKWKVYRFIQYDGNWYKSFEFEINVLS